MAMQDKPMTGKDRKGEPQVFSVWESNNPARPIGTVAKPIQTTKRKLQSLKSRR
jgi:hypothetical protein